MKNRDRVIATYGICLAITIILTPFLVDLVIPENKAWVSLGIGAGIAFAGAIATIFIWQHPD